VDLELDPIWDDYQRRKLTSQMVQIYHSRGLKRGLDKFLEIHLVTATSPRIAIDDCRKVIFMEPDPKGKAVPLTVAAAQKPLLTPQSVAIGPEGSFIVSDDGTSGLTPISPSGVYQLPPPGPGPQTAVRLGPGPGQWPVNANNNGDLAWPISVEVDGNTNAWNVYLLDSWGFKLWGGDVNAPTNYSLYRLASANFAQVTPLATFQQAAYGLNGLGLTWPVEMCSRAGILYILDRGTAPDLLNSNNQAPSATQIVEVQSAQNGPPVQVAAHAINGIVEPLAIVPRGDGKLIVADASAQNASAPADLFLVDPANAWAAVSLLGAVPQGKNPLVAPSSMALIDDQTVMVVDIGLRPFRTVIPHILTRRIANSAMVYRVDLSQNPPVITPASEPNNLIFPTDAIFDGRRVYISDQGEYADDTWADYPRLWRALEDEFGVVVNFSDTRPTQVDDRTKIIGNVRAIVEREKPAHSLFSMKYKPS
jgi:hypothetical protein